MKRRLEALQQAIVELDVLSAGLEGSVLAVHLELNTGLGEGCREVFCQVVPLHFCKELGQPIQDELLVLEGPGVSLPHSVVNSLDLLYEQVSDLLNLGEMGLIFSALKLALVQRLVHRHQLLEHTLADF